MSIILVCYFISWDMMYFEFYLMLILSCTLSLLDFFMTWVVHCLLFLNYISYLLWFGTLRRDIVNRKFGIICMFGCVSRNITFLLHNNCAYQMFLCRFDIDFFVHAIDFNQNFEYLWEKKSLQLLLLSPLLFRELFVRNENTQTGCV